MKPYFLKEKDQGPSFAVISSRFDVCANTCDYLAFLRGYPNPSFVDLVYRKQMGEDVSLFPLSDGFQLPYPGWIDQTIQLMSFKLLQEDESIMVMEIELKFKSRAKKLAIKAGMIDE
jgi:hypothetical protein